MSSVAAPEDQEQDVPWFLVGRRQEYAGERLANLMRIVGIGGFYAIHLLNYHGLQLGFLEFPRSATISAELHQAITALACSWIVLAAAVMVCLRNRVFPPYLKFVSTGADVVFLTSILLLTDGPRSALVVAYFLILCLAALRFHLVLIGFAVLSCAVGYLSVNGYARWFTERDIAVARYQQITVLLAFFLAGSLLLQIVHRTHAMAREYSRQLDKAGKSQDGSFS